MEKSNLSVTTESRTFFIGWNVESFLPQDMLNILSQSGGKKNNGLGQ